MDIFHSGLQPLSHDRLVGFLVFRPATTYHPVLEVNMEVIEMQEHIVAWVGPLRVFNPTDARRVAAPPRIGEWSWVRFPG